MMHEINNLLDFLKNAIYQKNIKVEINDQEKLYVIANENGLSGTIYQAVKSSITSKDVLGKFKKDFYLYLSDDEKKTKTIQTIKEIFNTNQIDYIFLKGTHLKRIYPKSYMRSMGDIDVLLREEQFKDATKLLKENHFIPGVKGEVHDGFKLNDVSVELHHKLKVSGDYFEYAVLDDVWQNIIHMQDNECQMKRVIEIIYLLFHLKKHLNATGVGLRNIIDIGIYLDTYKDEINISQLNQLLSLTKSETLFTNLVQFNDKYLGKAFATIFCKNTPFNDALYERFTAYVIQSGVHGYGVNFNLFLCKLASGKNKALTKKQSVLRMMFPPYDIIKHRYPKLLKHKIFLPIGWFLRIIETIFSKRKTIRIYLDGLKKVETADLEKTTELYKQMGI